MVRFDSWRAVSPGNGADRNLATKSTNGGRAIRRAVMRVKLEQARKAAMWMPIRRESGEGSTEREEPGAGVRPHDNHRVPIRSTGVVSTARRKGNQRQWGWPGSRVPRTPPESAADHLGVEEGQMYRGSRVTPVEGRTLASGVFVKEGRPGD